MESKELAWLTRRLRVASKLKVGARRAVGKRTAVVLIRPAASQWDVRDAEQNRHRRAVDFLLTEED